MLGEHFENKHKRSPLRVLSVQQVEGNVPGQNTATSIYLQSLGVTDMPAKTLAFDPGYDATTLSSHLDQSGHLISSLKLSMACWQVGNELEARKKISAAKAAGVTVSTGGGPFEIACACDRLPEYLDLCAELGFDRIEAGEGFVALRHSADDVLKQCRERGLEVYFELGEKHSGAFTPQDIDAIIEQGREWLDAGAVQLVIEARESADDVGLFDGRGNLNLEGADAIVEAFGLDKLIFEAPQKSSQFAFMRHYGAEVELGNVRLEEVLRVEIYRRGLHSDAFMHDKLRPAQANISGSGLL
jgi:phosphosulfolactate synthase